MDKLIVRGGKPLFGDVYINGMKNSALPIIISTVLVNDVCTVGNIPDVEDVALAVRILIDLGAKVRFVDSETALIDTRGVVSKPIPHEIASKMRGSSYLLGAMLGRFGDATVGIPGGCNFGDRPIDQHIKGFEALGAKVYYEHGSVRAHAPGGLTGSRTLLDMPSVGATANLIISSVFAQGTTYIENAAREPHIADLANFLNKCGASISGAGTNTIRIKGVQKLSGCRYSLLPDMIEAGTFIAATVAAGGNVNVINLVPAHLEAVYGKLAEIGAGISVYDNHITVKSDRNYRGTNIKAFYYPGFPTDMHPQFTAMLCLAKGMSSITEGVFENRFKYVTELKKMGADITVNEKTALINGRPHLNGATVHSADLRAGAALVIAGLCARGISEITGVDIIRRGYQNLEAKLQALGADITLGKS